MLTWIWNQISLGVPDAWEMLQFARDAQRGRCAFADRRRFRLELNWAAVPGEPDFGRMMSDYASKLESDMKMTDIQQARLCGCSGLIGQSPDGPIARYGKWIDSQKRLVEIVFLWPDTRDVELERQVLSSLAPSKPDREGLVSWRAFGLAPRVPAHLNFTSCSVQAARAGFLFKGKNPAETWVFRRYGMVDSWLKGDLEKWLNSQVPADIKDRSIRHSSKDGVQRIRMSGQYRPKGVLLKRGVFEASAWRHSKDGRLYLAMLTNPKTSPHAGREADRYLVAAPEFTVVP